jgi:hypothetical protein
MFRQYFSPNSKNPSRLPSRLRAFAVAFLCLAGCTENKRPTTATSPKPPPLATTEPIGVQMTRAEPHLVGTPFRTLLDFERRTDTAFLLPQSADPKPSNDVAHTGTQSLRIEHGGHFTVKLASLLSGSPFPGNWTIAGAYFSTGTKTGAPAKITISYKTSAAAAEPTLQRSIDLPPGERWTPVFLDLTPLAAQPTTEIGQITFDIEATQGVYCDDVVLINNSRTVETPVVASSNTPGGWTIRQSGFAILLERPDPFLRITLKTPEAAPDGWSIEEASDLRARFASANGKTWTIYTDGQQFKDGQFEPLSRSMPSASLYAAQHNSPAQIIVPPEFGRVDRDTPGDKNNDGYNEQRGSYELAAKGPRFECTIKPSSGVLLSPTLEISGLPQGPATITAEGQLIEKSVRLPNGNLLVQIPLTIERPTTINVTIK